MFTRISVSQTWEIIQNKPVTIVDIRDEVSYSQGHIAHALRLDNANVQSFLLNADRSRPLIVCCYHGHSSQQAADMFSQNGFEHCYSMDGGMCEWVLTHDVVVD